MPSHDQRGVGRLLVMNGTRGVALADCAARARGIWARTMGLMGVPGLPPGSGLLLPGDNAIHTCFMRIPIDVAFLDGRSAVVHLIPAMPPWRISPIVWRARSVLELPAGTLARTGTQVGDQLRFEDR